MKPKERAYLEVKDSCAICRERLHDNLTIHHIDHNRHNNTYENFIVLCNNCHIRYHDNKGIHIKDIRRIKKRLLTETLTQYGINALKIAYRKKAEIACFPFLINHLIELGYLKHTGEMMWEGDVDYIALYTITDKGKKIFEEWFL